jgi:chaperonin GroES
MKFRPLHDRVVVKRIEAEEKSAGGIIIPDTAKEKPSQGEVIAVGPGGRDEAGKLIPIDIQAGDRVLFGKWSGTEVKIDGQELLIMKESDVMGIIGRQPRVPKSIVSCIQFALSRRKHGGSGPLWSSNDFSYLRPMTLFPATFGEFLGNKRP